MRCMPSTWLLTFCLLFQSSAKETVEQAAVIARQLVDLSPTHIGSMATNFPCNDSVIPGEPFSFQEYYASCHQNGSLTLLFLPISRHSQNILHSPSSSASISVWSEPHPAASRPRVSLIGNVTIFYELSGVPKLSQLEACYLRQHPDAKRWIPGEREPHFAYWARFDPQIIYFVGGFGGQHFIGYIPLGVYQNAAPSFVDFWLGAEEILMEG